MNKWLNRILLAIGIGLIVWGSYGLLDGARLHPDRREVLIREVDNGYVVQYRTANNPYLIKEAVAASGHEVGLLVQGYLKQPLPRIDWGR